MPAFFWLVQLGIFSTEEIQCMSFRSMSVSSATIQTLRSLQLGLLSFWQSWRQHHLFHWITFISLLFIASASMSINHCYSRTQSLMAEGTFLLWIGPLFFCAPCCDEYALCLSWKVGRIHRTQQLNQPDSLYMLNAQLLWMIYWLSCDQENSYWFPGCL